MSNSFSVHSGTTTPPPKSLHAQLVDLLRQQLAIEERLTAQRALMQRITEGFGVLREWAARSAHHDLSLHDLLLVATYTREAHLHPDVATAEGEATRCSTNSDCPGEDGGVELMRETKRVYRSFICARIVDDTCPQPDSATQFHTLTADSFYILLPYLTELLRELVGGIGGTIPGQSQEAIANPGSIPSHPSLIPTLSPSLLVSTSSDWCSAFARVLRFLELGLKHFPDVMCEVPQCSSILEGLAHLRGSDISHHAGEAILVLRHRADALWVNLQRLCVVHGGENVTVKG